jgi:hypothetical protein
MGMPSVCQLDSEIFKSDDKQKKHTNSTVVSMIMLLSKKSEGPNHDSQNNI